LFDENIRTEFPPNQSPQEQYKYQIQMRDLQNRQKFVLEQYTNAPTQAQTQAQQMGMLNQNIAVGSPEPLPQQAFSQFQPQSQTFPILAQQSQQEVSMTPPNVPEGWKVQWNDQYEEW
jgi:hypothetical protein